MAQTVDNSEDVLDSRDVIARIEELEAERADIVSEDDDTSVVQDEAKAALKAWDEENGEELAALKAFADEISGYASDWEHGCALIRDSYFETYMDEMLEDCGDLPKNLPSYISISIDYEALQMDYSAVDFDGTTYWVR